MIGVVMQVRTKPGKADRFAELITALKQNVRKNEPDTLLFEVMRCAEDPEFFVFTEVFRTDAAREQHAEQPYHKAMSEEGWACVEGDPDIRTYVPLGWHEE